MPEVSVPNAREEAWKYLPTEFERFKQYFHEASPNEPVPHIETVFSEVLKKDINQLPGPQKVLMKILTGFNYSMAGAEVTEKLKFPRLVAKLALKVRTTFVPKGEQSNYKIERTHERAKNSEGARREKIVQQELRYEMRLIKLLKGLEAIDFNEKAHQKYLLPLVGFMGVLSAVSLASEGPLINPYLCIAGAGLLTHFSLILAQWEIKSRLMQPINKTMEKLQEKGVGFSLEEYIQDTFFDDDKGQWIY